MGVCRAVQSKFRSGGGVPETVIRLYNTPESFPVFTIADVDKLRTSPAD
jgi:hypothetical protein